MQYISAAILAFALGASARPQRNPYSPGCDGNPGAPPQSSGGAVPASSGAPVPTWSSYQSPPIIPTGTGSPIIPTGIVPTGSANYSSSSVGYSMPPVYAPSSAPVPVIPSEESSESESSSVSSTALVDPESASSSIAAPTVTATTISGGGSPASGGGMPASSGTSVLSAAQTVAAGETFDCGMVSYDRGVSCSEGEGGDSDAVFMLENGASLSNCIIGPNQLEGVHCFGSCTIKNVWWSAVCEDAFTVKEQSASETTTITGGGAFGAEDKVLQHNGGGTLSVSGFTVDVFGKVYRSCGNCDEMYERHVIMDDITATSGSQIAGINSNYGDTATLTNIKISDVDTVCAQYTGNDTGDEPEENGEGPSENCLYSESDVTEV